MEADIRDVRIERYFPDVLSNAKEFKAIAQAVNPELKLAWKALWKQMLNTFVYDIDEDGAARWEDMLSIIPPASDTLEMRKQRILSYINFALPFTHRSFQNMLNGIYGKDKIKVEIDYDKYFVWLKTEMRLDEIGNFIAPYTRAIIPANMGFVINKIINTKTLDKRKAIITKVKRVVTIHPEIKFTLPEFTEPMHMGGMVTLIKPINAVTKVTAKTRRKGMGLKIWRKIRMEMII